jgi:hypothetical protein
LEAPFRQEWAGGGKVDQFRDVILTLFMV